MDRVLSREPGLLAGLQRGRWVSLCQLAACLSHLWSLRECAVISRRQRASTRARFKGIRPAGRARAGLYQGEEKEGQEKATEKGGG